jgi:hypothetical protein
MLAIEDSMGPSLYVGGLNVGWLGQTATLARFDGQSWTEVNTGMAGQSVSMTAFDDGSGFGIYFGTMLVPSAQQVNLPNLSTLSCGPGRLRTRVVQEAAATAPAFILDSGRVPGREYHHVFSLDLCLQGIGQGPYLGLCSGNPQVLLIQYFLPLGSEPFHFQSFEVGRLFGPYMGLGPITVEMLLIEEIAGQIAGVSSVVRHSLL